MGRPRVCTRVSIAARAPLVSYLAGNLEAIPGVGCWQPMQRPGDPRRHATTVPVRICLDITKRAAVGRVACRQRSRPLLSSPVRRCHTLSNANANVPCAGKAGNDRCSLGRSQGSLFVFARTPLTTGSANVQLGLESKQTAASAYPWQGETPGSCAGRPFDVCFSFLVLRPPPLIS